MAFRLDTEAALADGVQRVAREQIDHALDDLVNGELPRAARVHQARKRFKKIRGVLRLARAALDERTYQAENAFFRDTARRLSGVRDADVLIEQFDALAEAYREAWEAGEFRAVREALVQHREAVARGEVDLDDRVAGVVNALAAARARVDSWAIAGEGFEALEPGFQKTYARGRNAFIAARVEPTVERLHEWRKRAKYHWYHVRLLQGLWPRAMKVRRRGLRKLTERLGEDHDLGMLRRLLTDHPGEYGAGLDCSMLLAVIDHRRAKCQEKAWSLGERLYVARPGRLAQQLRRRWRVCQVGA